MLEEPRVALHRPPRLRLVPREVVDVIETTGGTVTARVVDTLAELVALEREWNELFTRSASASPPLQWGWVREWWRYFGTPNRSLAIVTVRQGSQLIGVLPLYRETDARKRAALFSVSLSRESSHSFYPEYIDVLTAPGSDAAVTGAIIKLVSDMGWGRLEAIQLGLCRKGGLLERVIAPAMKVPWGSIERTEFRAPVADLRGGLEGYLRALSTNARQQMRRLLRSFRELNGTHFEIAHSREEADRFLLELIELHQKRWHAENEPGAFSTPERIAFHRAVVERLFESVVLSRLSYQGETIAVLYGFLVGRKFDFYQSGNSACEIPLKRPGILAHLLTMEALSKNGLETYDFLEGEAPYKVQLRTATVELTELTVYGPSPRNIVHRCHRDFSSLLRRVLR